MVTNANTIIPKKENKPHDTKMTIMISLTLILGLLTVLTLLSVLSYNKTPAKEKAAEQNVEIVQDEMPSEKVESDDELGRNQLIKDFEKLELEKATNFYSEETFDAGL